MEICDIQNVNGMIEVTFMNEYGDDVMVLTLSPSDARQIGDFAQSR